MATKDCVMVIDDDVIFLDIIEAIIGEYYNVVAAKSGTQALELLRNGIIPDLILLDIAMPEMDGYETLEHICDIKELSWIPVVFLTGMNSSADELTGLELGAQDYISKPFVRDNLLARIHIRIDSGRQIRKLYTVQEQLLQEHYHLQTNLTEYKFDISIQKLTTAELKVARLIAHGCDNHEIAQQLYYSNGYVKNLITRIYDKLSVSNRCELWKLLQMEPSEILVKNTDQ